MHQWILQLKYGVTNLMVCCKFSIAVIFINVLFSGEFALVQNIDLNYGICVGLNCIYLSNISTILLAAGLDDSSIALYSLSDFEHMTFSCFEKLKGHEDWVRGLDFAIESVYIKFTKCVNDINYCLIYR